jgi:hypothetical protein
MVTDLRALEYLAPWLHGEHTLSSAAAAVGVSPSTMAYWLPRFCDLGLVEVTGTRQRAGMASKVYRATAEVFVVNAGRVDPARLAAFTGAADAELRQAIEAAMTRKNLWSAVRLEIHRGLGAADVGAGIRLEPDVALDGVLCLASESFSMGAELAREFRDELLAFVGRYKARAEPGSQYLIQLAVAPLAQTGNSKVTGCP